MSDSESQGEQDGLDVLSVSHVRFAATSRLANGSLIVALSGTADSEVASTLGTFLERLHAEAVSSGVKEVVLDFRDLQFLTSSCIKYLVVAIKRLTGTEPATQYELRLVTATGVRWQELSLQVLRQMAPRLVTLEHR